VGDVRHFIFAFIIFAIAAALPVAVAMASCLLDH
jgi:hypothetical protein